MSFCKDNNISSAWVQAIGAVSEADISAYDLAAKEYIKKHLEGMLEIANLTGNIGTLNNELVPHIHITVADREFRAFGGHLDRAIVAATCEILIAPLDCEIIRKHDPEIGLNLIEDFFRP